MSTKGSTQATLVSSSGAKQAVSTGAVMSTTREEIQELFESSIESAASRAGVDTKGTVGLAVVYTMEQAIVGLKTKTAQLAIDLELMTAQRDRLTKGVVKLQALMAKVAGMEVDEVSGLLLDATEGE